MSIRNFRVALALSALVLFTACAVLPHSAPAPTKDETTAAFARLKALAGTWQGTSTKGWSEKVEYRVIAGGSAVMEMSFDAHPGETMATLFHPDGDRLLVTHYCVAKNQPRLCLTTVADGGATLDFTFLDATNLKSRDVGHMDRVKLHFVDDDHFTAQWTWYQDGKENWMEEIRNERVKTDAANSGG